MLFSVVRRRRLGGGGGRWLGLSGCGFLRMSNRVGVGDCGGWWMRGFGGVRGVHSLLSLLLTFLGRCLELMAVADLSALGSFRSKDA